MNRKPSPKSGAQEWVDDEYVAPDEDVVPETKSEGPIGNQVTLDAEPGPEGGFTIVIYGDKLNEPIKIGLPKLLATQFIGKLKKILR